MKPDVLARIRMNTVNHRHGPISPPKFRCPFVFEGELFDCQLLLEAVPNAIVPGDVVDVPIKFLNPAMVKPRLATGVRFKLWDLGNFAEGEV